MSSVKRYLIDSMVVIWAIKKTGDPFKVTEGQKFLDFVDKNGKQIELYLPSPVLAEILSPHSTNDPLYGEILSEVSKEFVILPFDSQSAIIASRLLNEYRNDTDLINMLKANGLNQNLSSKIKFDIQIVSIGIANKMDGVISEEKNAVKAYANGKIDVLTMAQVMNTGKPPQTSLFQQ